MKAIITRWWHAMTQRFRWLCGHRAEVQFWDRYLKTKGLRWPQEYAARLNPSLELGEELGSLLSAAAGDTPKVLDVGAGPLTVVGRQWRGQPLALTAIDPLAKDYDVLLERYQLKPPVRTIPGKAEDADTLFPQASFDLVHARNCLDHAIDPFASIQKMLKLVKRGGYMYLKHHPDEALQQNWRGLHQWNFSCLPEGDFIIASRTDSINVTEKLKNEAAVSCELRSEAEEAWLTVKLQRR